MSGFEAIISLLTLESEMSPDFVLMDILVFSGYGALIISNNVISIQIDENTFYVHLGKNEIKISKI